MVSSQNGEEPRIDPTQHYPTFIRAKVNAEPYVIMSWVTVLTDVQRFWLSTFCVVDGGSDNGRKANRRSYPTLNLILNIFSSFIMLNEASIHV